MTKKEFIKQIASLVQKYAPRYGICVNSPIIAQAILESASGTSELAVKANNYFGLKYKPGRCPSGCGFYEKVGSEQKSDGSYTSSVMLWYKFPDMESGVKGYFEFISNKRYENLKGVTIPQKYLELIKAAGYATSIKYVDNLMAVIEKYDLTQYDVKEKKGMIIALDAGHGYNTAGKRCLKSIDPNQTREWSMSSRDASNLQELLKDYDCEVIRVDDVTGKTDVSLSKRVKVANDAKADIYISLHYNAGIYGRIFGYKNKPAGGTVVFWYSKAAERQKQAQNLYNAIVAKTGLVGDRATPVSKKGYDVIKNTNMPAFLCELGFMDSPTDVPVILTMEHSKKVAEGILTFLVSELGLAKKNVSTSLTEPLEPMKNRTYEVKSGDTLSKIGKTLGIPWKEIAELNGIKAPYRIITGQILQIPVK